MPSRLSPDRTAKLLLWFSREPTRYHTEARRVGARALDGDVVLRLALGRRVQFADPALNHSNAAALRDAAASYVRQVFFHADATPWETLGLEPDASSAAIKERFRLLMQLVHPDRQNARALWPESFAAKANIAYGNLRNEESRAQAARASVPAVAPSQPGARWPKPNYGGRRPLPRPVLPEWLTAGVGGFVRGHPVVTSFGALLAGAALVIGATLSEGPGGLLTREAREAHGPVLAPVRAPEPSSPDPVPAMPKTAPPAVLPSSKPVPTRPLLAPSPAEAASVTPTAVVDAGHALPSSDATQRPVAVKESPPAAPAVARADSTVVALAPAPAPSAVSPPPTLTPASLSAAAPARIEPLMPATPTPVPQQAPTNAEVEALLAAFVDSYDRGRIEVFAALFDDDAETNLRHGRAAIRGEYDELFRQSNWRRMQLTRINWRGVGDRAYAKGELAVKIGWRDGREVEQHVAVDMEMARRNGHLVITRLAHQPTAP